MDCVCGGGGGGGGGSGQVTKSQLVSIAVSGLYGPARAGPFYEIRI